MKQRSSRHDCRRRSYCGCRYVRFAKKIDEARRPCFCDRRANPSRALRLIDPRIKRRRIRLRGAKLRYVRAAAEAFRVVIEECSRRSGKHHRTGSVSRSLRAALSVKDADIFPRYVDADDLHQFSVDENVRDVPRTSSRTSNSIINAGAEAADVRHARELKALRTRTDSSSQRRLREWRSDLREQSARQEEQRES